MPDEAPRPGGWLPPAAPGGKPPPRFDAGAWSPPRSPAPQPAPASEHATGTEHPPAPRFDAPAPMGNATAVWALVLGIAGLTLLLVSFGTLFLITLPLSASAWFMAMRARAAIAEGRATTGDSQATAALWLGRAGVIAGVAAAGVLIALIASGFDFEELRRDLEREMERRRRDEGGGAGGVRTAIEGLRALARR